MEQGEGLVPSQGWPSESCQEQVQEERRVLQGWPPCDELVPEEGRKLEVWRQEPSREER